MGKKTFRKQYIFHLDLEKPTEDSLALRIDDLKEKRAYSRCVKNGIAIAADLEAGKLDTLLEVYPWVGELLKKAGQEDTTPNSRTGGNGTASDAALGETANYLLQLMERKLLQSRAQPIPHGQPSSNTPPQKPTPAAMDDTAIAAKLEVTTSKVAADRWGNFKTLYNMQLSLYGAEPRQWDNLTNDCLEYGLETGQFMPVLVKQAEQLLASRRKGKTPQVQAKTGERKPIEGKAKALQGANIPLAAPNLDDLDLALLGG